MQKQISIMWEIQIIIKLFVYHINRSYFISPKNDENNYFYIHKDSVLRLCYVVCTIWTSYTAVIKYLVKQFLLKKLI